MTYLHRCDPLWDYVEAYGTLQRGSSFSIVDEPVEVGLEHLKLRSSATVCATAQAYPLFQKRSKS